MAGDRLDNIAFQENVCASPPQPHWHWAARLAQHLPKSLDGRELKATLIYATTDLPAVGLMSWTCK